MAEQIKSNPKAGEDKSGTPIGTEEQPHTLGLPDPESAATGSGYRFAEKHGATVQTHTTEDGRKLTWTDPDAVPGTIGDDPGETMEALADAGAPAVKVESKK